MKILYYECFAGISGDMNLGALLDLGVDRGFLLEEIKKLGLDDYEIQIGPDKRKGISGTRVEVRAGGHSAHSTLNGGKQHQNRSPHHQEQRNLQAIQGIIRASGLNDRVKELSLAMFQKLAEAEAKVHGTSIDKIHFHEVGAVDSIIDIVGAALCFDNLGVDRVYASPVELGGGTVQCAHGVLPVPAPATAELLRGKPVKLGTVPFETTTPTGAVILATLVNEFTSRLDMQIERIGYGIGSRDTDMPNVLRVFLGEVSEEAGDSETETAYLLECNIDDMNPELFEPVMDSLFAHGADDVFLTSIIMKKSRPAVKLNVLCRAERCERLKELILTQTPTLGVRRYGYEKTTLPRDYSELNTDYGMVRIKNAYFRGEKIKSKPEFEDCRRLAEERGVSLQEIYNSISRTQRQKKNGNH